MFMDKHRPDVVGTQELTIEAIADMKAILPGYKWFGLGRYGGTDGEFAAIFYNANKLNCRAEDTFWLGKRPAVAGSRGLLAAYPRVCTWGVFREVGGDANLVVYNTHLDHLSPWARKNGLKQISRFVKKLNTGYPSILMGDFNARPQSRAIKAFHDTSIHYDQFFGNNFKAFLNEENRIGRTHHGFTGKVVGQPIDYIFTTRDILVKQVDVDHNQYNGSYPSDHFPIVMQATIL
ncbi:MAG: endonuclease/exonuclease/phosphatase family protein [Methylocystaceae bacterium]